MAYNYDRLEVGDEVDFEEYGRLVGGNLKGVVVDRRGEMVLISWSKGRLSSWFGNDYHSPKSHWVVTKKVNPLEVY